MQVYYEKCKLFCKWALDWFGKFGRYAWGRRLALCLTSGTTTACPVGANCTYLYSDNCYTGDEVGESAGSYHSCGGWGCGAQAECNGFAGGFACKCFMKDTCP